MATALKIRGEEFVHDLTSHVRVDETSRHDQHIGIVVLTAQMGDFRNPAQACAYALVLVQRHADAFAAAADGYARIAFPVFYGLGQRMGIVGIVSTGFGIRAEILIGITFFGEVFLHELLECVSCVV